MAVTATAAARTTAATIVTTTTAMIATTAMTRNDGYRAQGGGRGNEGWGEERRYDGAGPNHNFRRGGRLPSQYRSNQYVVNNYREHHLRPPPRGYHWVQTGGDYVLAAVATGIIADLIINH
jgi:Ni/Co efflux regulator RcnB